MTEMDVDQLPDDPAVLKTLLKRVCNQSRHEIEQLEHRLDLLLRSKYGPRSERFAPNQQTLFDLGDAEQEAESTAETPEPADEEAKNEQRRSRPHGRRRLPKNLPRERRVHELPSGQLACPCCGQNRECFGYEVSEQLDYEPAQLKVIEHARAKYACRHCQEQVVVAAKPPQPIEKGLAAAGLLAAIGVSKFGDHLPLYRLEEILSRSGLQIQRSTQCGWMKAVGQLCEPIVHRMGERVLAGDIIWTDDTTLPVLDPTQNHTRTGRMWVYIGDLQHRYAVFEYSPNRQGEHPRKFLANYQGYLQADAYTGYDAVYMQQQVKEVGCWAHARRKFDEAKATARTTALEALSRIGQLYRLETQGAKLSDELRHALRQKQAIQQLANFKGWLDAQVPNHVPKSPAAAAIQYTLRNWEALCRYTEDPRLSIDNNLSERMLRPIAIGRKNYLFAGNDQGGDTAAVLYSLIGTCKLLHIDPYRYLRSLLETLPTLGPSPSAAELDQSLPDAWFLRHPEAHLVQRDPADPTNVARKS